MAEQTDVSPFTRIAMLFQANAGGDIQFEHPSALAEIALIVLAVKLDNSLIPSTHEEATDTLKGLIELLEKGTGAPAGTFDYLTLI